MSLREITLILIILFYILIILKLNIYEIVS